MKIEVNFPKKIDLEFYRNEPQGVTPGTKFLAPISNDILGSKIGFVIKKLSKFNI